MQLKCHALVVFLLSVVGSHSALSLSSTHSTKPVSSPSPPVLDVEFQKSYPFDSKKPGMREDDLFQCDESVRFWKDFQSEGNQKNVERAIAVVSDEANRGSLGTAYWASHLIRTGYFTMNAALGSIASDIHGRFIANRDGNQNNSKDEATSNGTLFGKSDGMLRSLSNSDIPSRLFLEVAQVYAQEFKYVKQGLMKFPWDALLRVDGVQFNHKQANPFFALTETLETVRESVGIFSRRNKGVPKGVFVSKSDIYPQYYLNDFHYQTDGWLSSLSAQRYEASTETLFLGRQDAMQRQTLIPILKSRVNAESILEVACGTGRFGTFLRDNFPQAKMTYSDLSPFYLEKAKANDKYWMTQRGEVAMQEETSVKRMPEPASFVQANAEKLPFDDNSFDVVTCIYLFHELPEEARKRAASEMVRVVKPGGMIVLTDSFQLGDRPALDANIANFSKLNEPHYANYINTFLPDLFPGCDYGEKLMASSSKTLSFVKRGSI